MDQGLFCRIRGADGVPQNCEVAARSPPLAARRTDTRNGPACVGFIDEWHLDLGNPFRHLAFDLAARLCQPPVMIAAVLFHSRFEAIGTVTHSMRCDGMK